MVSVFDLLVLSQVPSIGPSRLRALVSHFGDAGKVLRATAREIVRVEGFSKKLAVIIAHGVRSARLEEARRYAARQLSRLNAVGGSIVTCWDPRYPEALRRIYDPPTYLYVQGDLRPDDRLALALVGTRNPSEYGAAMAERFSGEIAKLGITVVSGLARGIDTVVHRAALSAGGRTLAVIGSGLDIIYPEENKKLAERIAGQGAVISEYEMGAKPDAVNFPRRNRIISGLSMGTVVIETDVNGGAMITATTALDQNREVFALPGNVTNKRVRGCHTLIREGRAKLVESVADILEEFSATLSLRRGDTSTLPTRPEPALTLFEKAVFDVLSDRPVHIDHIAAQARMSTADALVNLLNLEFKGLIRQMPGKMFSRA